jgi:hypothetical protein
MNERTHDKDRAAEFTELTPPIRTDTKMAGLKHLSPLEMKIWL